MVLISKAKFVEQKQYILLDQQIHLGEKKTDKPSGTQALLQEKILLLPINPAPFRSLDHHNYNTTASRFL